ncbi:MAG TPA: CsbD family protein [Caulobacter sp.]|nr:CsbD family protein [Caulobacter sp.]
MWDRIEGSWKEMSGKVKEQWGKLTDDDLTVVAGKRDQLAGKIQERYGYAKDKADEEISAFERRMDEDRSFRS